MRRHSVIEHPSGQVDSSSSPFSYSLTLSQSVLLFSCISYTLTIPIFPLSGLTWSPSGRLDTSRAPAMDIGNMLGEGGAGAIGQFPLEQWFYEMPVCTRWWTAATVATSLLVQCHIITPFQLFYSFRAVFVKNQVSSFCCNIFTFSSLLYTAFSSS